MSGTIYLFHFDRPYRHARHSLGTPRASTRGSLRTDRVAARRFAAPPPP
jgi:hypothetical protein